MFTPTPINTDSQHVGAVVMNISQGERRLFMTAIVCFVVGVVCAYGVARYERHMLELEIEEVMRFEPALNAHGHLKILNELNSGNIQGAIHVNEKLLQSELTMLKAYPKNGTGFYRNYIEKVRTNTEAYLDKSAELPISDEVSARSSILLK